MRTELVVSLMSIGNVGLPIWERTRNSVWIEVCCAHAVLYSILFLTSLKGNRVVTGAWFLIWRNGRQEIWKRRVHAEMVLCAQWGKVWSLDLEALVFRGHVVRVSPHTVTRLVCLIRSIPAFWSEAWRWLETLGHLRNDLEGTPGWASVDKPREFQS